MKKYNVFKNKKIDFHIKEMFLQDIKIKENFTEDEFMNIIYNDLKNFLLDWNIRIWKSWKLILDKETIKIVVSKDLSNVMKHVKPIKSKKLIFGKKRV